jgi:phage replication initiation protein
MDKWITEYRVKRLEYGISQQKAAVYTGISREYLNRLEQGAVLLTDSMKEKLTNTLEKLKPDTPLFLLIDYVRIRFPTTDIKYVVEHLLQIKMLYMGHEDYGFYSYPEHYYHGDIFVLASPKLEQGILLELKGKGCRQFETYLHAQGRDWIDFFNDCIQANGIMKRLDLAINDRTGLLDITELIDKCKCGECISVFRAFEDYGSGELIPSSEPHKTIMGKTLYLGSKKSEVYMCIYEKAYEQYMKQGIPLEEAEIKNRFEIRLKNERATKAVHDLLTNYDPEQTAFSIINRYVRFVDAEPGKERYEWKENPKWLYFIGTKRQPLKLTTQPEPYTFDRSMRWLHHQVAQTLKTATELDKLEGTHIIENMVQQTKLSKKYQQILKQKTANIQEMIATKERG